MAGDDTGRQYVRPTIWASWRRCQQLKVDPTLPKLPLVSSAQDLAEEQERGDLLHVAPPYFDVILKTWEEERFLIGLHNRRGHILYVDGNPAFLEQGRAMNIVPSAGTAEADIGTALANIVLAQGQADYVLWSEHYCQVFHDLATIGAPIFHPQSRETVGLVGVAGAAIAHPRALELVQYFAQRIEQLLHHEQLVRQTNLLDAYHRFALQHPHDVVLAIDAYGQVCGASPSLSRFFETPRQVLGQSVSRLPGVQLEGFQSVTLQKTPQTYEVQVDIPAKDLSLKAVAMPIAGERQPVGTLLVMPPGPGAQRSRERAEASGWTATYTFADMVGTAALFRACATQAQQAATGHYPVLLLGESGTGKELFAQAIHTASPRKTHPFVAVNCGAASDELLAAELFGYVEGAFTGAVKGGKKGALELAHGGTLFLDEVEAMPSKMQVSLLRVLEEGRLTRVGAERPVAVDVRIIAASNEDLQTAIQDKRFRLDLYHRLCVFPIRLPALRDRQEDIAELTRLLLIQLGYRQLQLADETLAALKRYAWPGNVRELKNVLLRAAHLADGRLITPAALPPEVIGEAAERPQPPTSLRDTERELIRRALAETHGNMAQAAAQLGIHRVTLYRKLKRYGLGADCDL